MRRAVRRFFLDFFSSSATQLSMSSLNGPKTGASFFSVNVYRGTLPFSNIFGMVLRECPVSLATCRMLLPSTSTIRRILSFSFMSNISLPPLS